MAQAIIESHEHQHESGIQKVASGPERLVQFLKDVRLEMRKVVTPTRAEVRNTTIVVIVTVFLFAAYFALVDQIIGRGIDKLIVQLTKH